MSLLNPKKSISVTVNQSRNNPFWPLQQELNKAMNNFYGLFEPFNFPIERFENLALYPAIDIVDDKNQFKVVAEMPGMSEEDIKVSVDNGLLTIRGEKTTSKGDQGKSYMMREISYGNYERSVALPDTVDLDKANATFKKGMLWIEIPKKPESTKKSRALEVKKA